MKGLKGEVGEKFELLGIVIVGYGRTISYDITLFSVQRLH